MSRHIFSPDCKIENSCRKLEQYTFGLTINTSVPGTNRDWIKLLRFNGKKKNSMKYSVV